MNVYVCACIESFVENLLLYEVEIYEIHIELFFCKIHSVLYTFIYTYT